jgi:hypothetical protein
MFASEAFGSSRRRGVPGTTDIDKGPTGTCASRQASGGWLAFTGLIRVLFVATLLVGNQCAAAESIRMFFERDTDGSAGSDLALVSFASLTDAIAGTSLVSQFSQVDVDPSFSVRGVTYDGSAYRFFFERDTNGVAGNELAIVSFPSLADFVNGTGAISQFTQIDIDPAFSIGGVTYDGSAYRLLFERDIDGTAGNELALVSFPALGDLIANTSSVTQFTQIDVDPAFSVRGFAFDSGLDGYRLLFERDLNGSAGNELAFVSFPSLADLINATGSTSQFTQIDVDPNYSVAGLIIEPDSTGSSVDEPGTLTLMASVLLFWAWRGRLRLPVCRERRGG